MSFYSFVFLLPLVLYVEVFKVFSFLDHHRLVVWRFPLVFRCVWNPTKFAIARQKARTESTTHQLISKLSPAIPFGAFGVCINSCQTKGSPGHTAATGETTWLTRVVHVTAKATWVTRVRKPRGFLLGKRYQFGAPSSPPGENGPPVVRTAFLDRHILVFRLRMYDGQWRLCEGWDQHGSHCVLRQWSVHANLPDVGILTYL